MLTQVVDKCVEISGLVIMNYADQITHLMEIWSGDAMEGGWTLKVMMAHCPAEGNSWSLWLILHPLV